MSSSCIFELSSLCSALEKPQWTPTTEDTLKKWCVARTSGVHKPKELRALLTLGLWELWKHRNAVVFDGASPSLEVVVRRVVAEGRAWQQASLLKGEVDITFQLLVGWAGSE